MSLNFLGFHIQQQQQPIAMPTNSMNSMAPNSMAANPMPTNVTRSAPAQPPPTLQTITQPSPQTIPQPPPQTILQPPVQQQKTCKLDGCSKPVYVENGRVHDFCGRKHAAAYKSAGELMAMS